MILAVVAAISISESAPAAPLAAGKSVVERLGGAAGNAKDILDTKLFQIGNNKVCDFRYFGGVR